MVKKPCVAVILLNYNSEEDLFASTEQITKQIGIDLITIVVDNASNENSVKKIQSWSQSQFPNSFSGSTDELFELTFTNKLRINDYSTYFIYNTDNKGYSAGNNIGIKLADYLNVDAVLIANPDMRFENEQYIYELTKTLFSDPKNFIAASKIIGLDGKNQNPLREATFIEELLWFMSYIKPVSYILPYSADKIMTVPKVSGCCLLLRMNFLKEIDYFDETTFLYSEEPILAAQVKNKGGNIVFTPYIEAIHAHRVGSKGNSSKRMLKFIESRKYYLRNYSGYNTIQLNLLNLSYFILASAHKIKACCTR